jgi:probable HAF family extracellular repeat protein
MQSAFMQHPFVATGFVRSRILSFTTLLLALAATASAAEPRYTIVSVGPMPPYASRTQGNAINSRGQVVGNASEPGFPRVAGFLWTRGATNGIPGNRQMRDLGNLAGGDYFFNTSAWGINTRGQVVGETDFDWWGWHVSHAFLWDNGTMQDLGTLPGGNWSVARDINDYGKITGYAATDSSGTLDGHPHAFVYDIATRQMRDLGIDNSLAASINNKSQVAGSFFPPDGSEHAFYWDPTTGMHDIHSFVRCGGTTTEAFDINDNTQIVGYCTDANRVAHAFFYDARTGRVLRLDWPEAKAASVNNLGKVVGTFRDSLLVDHAFVWDSTTGQAYDLNKVVMTNDSWELFYPWGINDAGQITGAGSHVAPEDGLHHGRGFVLTPNTTTASLQSLSITPTSVPGSSRATGTVTLTKAAPAGGALVSLNNPIWTLTSTPDTVLVPSGATSASFPVEIGPVWYPATAEVEAIYFGIKRSVTLSISPR